MPISEETTWEGQPVLITWLPGYRPQTAETVSQVSGLCMTTEGRIILVSENGRTWSLPGGKPEGQETWEETLRREVAEEACANLLLCQSIGAQRVEGLTPQPSYQLRYWARVSLQPFHPVFETRRRKIVSAGEYADVLSWGPEPIGQALLRQALTTERELRGR